MRANFAHRLRMDPARLGNFVNPHFLAQIAEDEQLDALKARGQNRGKLMYANNREERLIETKLFLQTSNHIDVARRRKMDGRVSQSILPALTPENTLQEIPAIPKIPFPRMRKFCRFDLGNVSTALALNPDEMNGRG